MSNPSPPPLFAKATKGIHRVRRLSTGLPFEASLTEAKNGDEVGCFEDLEVALGGVVALGAVDDGLGRFVPSDFLEGEGMAEEIFRQTFAACGVVGGDGFFTAIVDAEAAVFPRQEVGEFSGADEFGVAEGVEEAVAKEFDSGGKVFGGHAVEASVGREESVGGEDVEVGVENQIIAEGVDGGDGCEFSIGEIEAGAEGIAQGFGGGVEEVGEEMAAFAEVAAQDFGDGEGSKVEKFRRKASLVLFVSQSFGGLSNAMMSRMPMIRRRVFLSPSGGWENSWASRVWGSARAWKDPSTYW